MCMLVLMLTFFVQKQNLVKFLQQLNIFRHNLKVLEQRLPTIYIRLVFLIVDSAIDSNMRVESLYDKWACKYLNMYWLLLLLEQGRCTWLLQSRGWFDSCRQTSVVNVPSDADCTQHAAASPRSYEQSKQCHSRTGACTECVHIYIDRN